MTQATARKKTPELRLVDHNQSVSDVADLGAPPMAPTILAIDPLIAYRSDQQRRILEAQGEIDLRREQDRLADLALAARVKKSADDHDRYVWFETQKRDAERRESQTEIEKFENIIFGGGAALEATDAPAEIAAD